jgi:RES domain-containing protein
MVAVYRLVKKKFAASAFDGEGARLYGGRWNSPGVACTYAAGSESLALLEVLVHLQNTAVLRHYTLVRLEIPEALIDIPALSKLPADWQEPDSSGARQHGDAWLSKESDSLALAVPSTVSPQELNYLLKASHKKLPGLLAKATELQFSPDPRIVGLQRG